MREIPASDNLTLKVFSEGGSETLEGTAIMIMPYMTSRSNGNENSIVVLKTGVVGWLKVSRTGVYGTGAGFTGVSIENRVADPDEDPMKRVGEYRDLLKTTERPPSRNPVSIVLVEGSSGYTLDELLQPVFRTYKDIYLEENKQQWEKAVAMATAESYQQFRWYTTNGLRRILMNRTITTYFVPRGCDPEILKYIQQVEPLAMRLLQFFQ